MNNSVYTTQQNLEPVLEEKVFGSRKLAISFGGIKGAMGIPAFEFYKSSRIFDHNKIFVRDFRQHWYQSGLKNISHDVDSTAEYLYSRIRSINPEEVVFIGNSMGGYAAILFSSLLNTGSAIAFSPQTTIGLSSKLALGDFRWKRALSRTYINSLAKKNYFDLLPLLAKEGRKNRISIHVSALDKQDMRHAVRIANQPLVTLNTYNFGGHNLVKHLKQKNLLSTILENSF